MVAIPQSGLLAQVSLLRLCSGHSGQILTLGNAASASLPSPCLQVAGAGICAASLLLCWGSYHWARDLWALIIYLFFLPVMLPSVLPRLATDSAVRVFPGVWKLLSFKDSLPGMELRPYLFCLLLCLLYIFLPPFEDNGLLFWVPDVLCQHSEVVLWNLLGIQMFF